MNERQVLGRPMIGTNVWLWVLAAADRSAGVDQVSPFLCSGANVWI